MAAIQSAKYFHELITGTSLMQMDKRLGAVITIVFCRWTLDITTIARPLISFSRARIGVLVSFNVLCQSLLLQRSRYGHHRVRPSYSLVSTSQSDCYFVFCQIPSYSQLGSKLSVFVILQQFPVATFFYRLNSR